MAGESGGELDAAMLGMGMLDGQPWNTALSVESAAVTTSAADALLSFIAAAESGAVAVVGVDALLAFIAQAESAGVDSSNVAALLTFAVQEIGVAGAGSLSLDAWLQMLHNAGDVAAYSMLVGVEQRLLMIYDEARVIQVQKDYSADQVINDMQAVNV